MQLKNAKGSIQAVEYKAKVQQASAHGAPKVKEKD
jgi:hypothetical protein